MSTTQYVRSIPRRRGRFGRTSAHTLSLYFPLAFVLSWAAWIPAGLAARDSIDLPGPVTAWLIVGGFGPMVAALVATARFEGRSGIGRLARSLDPRGVGMRWLVLTTILAPLNLLPVLTHLAGGGQPPSTSVLIQAALVFPVQVVFVAIAGGGLDEEVGWRGVALPGLLQRTTPLTAHLLLGVVWACWHLPLWLDPHGPHAQYPFWLYLLKTLAISVLIGWLYTASGGSLAIAVLAHAISNSADGARYQLLGDHAGTLGAQVVLTIGLLLAATVVATRTRGRLGTESS